MSVRNLRTSDALVVGVGSLLQILCPIFFIALGYQMLVVAVALPLLYVCGVLMVSQGLTRVEAGQTDAFWLYFALGFFFPMYGAVGSVLISLYKSRTRSNAQEVVTDIEDAYASSDIQEEIAARTEIRSEDDETRIHDELMVQPYVDIMLGPNRNLKKTLITKIINSWTPNGIDLLKIALGDIDYDIRSYAATGLRRIEDQMSSKVVELKEKLRSEPQNTEGKLELARLYLYMIRKGIADPSLSEHYLSVCDTVLTEAESQSMSRDMHLELLSVRAQVAHLAQDPGLERKLLEQILAIDPDNVETLAGMCYLQFRCRDFASLVDTSQRFVQATPVNHPLADAARLWAQIDRRTSRAE